ncbi:hypothetical protein ACRBEV_10990 [Methylobacterium phyllosphaerae]
MKKSLSEFSYDNILGAVHDQSSEADTEIIRPPEIDPLISNATVLPPKLNVFLAGYDPSEAKVLRDSALHILNNEKQGIIGRIDNGLELIARKVKLGHGRYMEYISTLEISEKHAERCTNVARHFSRYRDLVSGVAWTALCDLAAKSTPDEARDEVIARLKTGEYLTRQDIKKVIESASSPKPQPVTKTDRPGLPRSSLSAPEKRPDDLNALPDRSRAVALLAHAGDSITGKANDVAGTTSDVQPSGDQTPDAAYLSVRAIALLPAPQSQSVPSEVRAHIPTVMQGYPPAPMSLAQLDCANNEEAIEEATSSSDLHKAGEQEGDTELSPVKVFGMLSDKLTREEGRELLLCMKFKGSELMHLLGQYYSMAEADAFAMGGDRDKPAAFD